MYRQLDDEQTNIIIDVGAKYGSDYRLLTDVHKIAPRDLGYTDVDADVATFIQTIIDETAGTYTSQANLTKRIDQALYAQYAGKRN